MRNIDFSLLTIKQHKIKLGIIAALMGILPLALVSHVAGDQKHTVVAGDTLWDLAATYSVSVAELANLNNIDDPRLIIVGDELLIPGAPAPEAPPTGNLYTVQAGENLSEIANRFGLATNELAVANNLENPRLIHAGQQLNIPGSVSPETPVVVQNGAPMVAPRPNDPATEAIMDQAAAEFGVDARLVKAIATVESAWQQGAVSPTGAVGVMQIMPGTAEYLETNVFLAPMNEDTSIEDNIRMGAKLLSVLISTTGTERDAVAAYYQGLTPTQSGVYYPDTQGYVASVYATKYLYWP
jgi:LysM repeat protein